MSDRNLPRTSIEELERKYGGQRLSHGRLRELLNTCVLNEASARGRSATFHHDLVVALLMLERGWTHGEPEGPSLLAIGRRMQVGTPSSLEAAARDLLKCVQNKHEPMSHPDNVRLTNEGATILVNEARLWMLQLALPHLAKRDPSAP